MRRLMATGVAAVLVFGAVILWESRGDSGESAAVELPATEALALYNPACGCCGEHIEYLRSAGVTVEEQTVDDMGPVKAQNGVPDDMASCHTTLIAGYTIEGHMPSEAIAKLLDERPDIIGIALPAMPPGSPGMGGEKNETWVIYALEHDGTTSVFMEI